MRNLEAAHRYYDKHRKEILERRRKRYQEDSEYRERLSDNRKRHRSKHRVELNKYNREYRRSHKEQMLKWPSTRKKNIVDKCPLCFEVKRLCYDHSHKTGRFRGWICEACNKALGFVKDSVETLKRMETYLSGT